MLQPFCITILQCLVRVGAGYPSAYPTLCRRQCYSPPAPLHHKLQTPLRPAFQAGHCMGSVQTECAAQDKAVCLIWNQHVQMCQPARWTANTSRQHNLQTTALPTALHQGSGPFYCIRSCPAAASSSTNSDKQRMLSDGPPTDLPLTVHSDADRDTHRQTRRHRHV